MSTQVERDLVLSAAMLAKSYPELWERFVKTLHARSHEAADHFLLSDKDNLQINQGRAQAYHVIYVTLADCIRRAEQIEGIKNG